jgi:riboflavin-specific deaminase-like protein
MAQARCRKDETHGARRGRVPVRDLPAAQHFRGRDRQRAWKASFDTDGAPRAQFAHGALNAQAARIPEPPCQVPAGGPNLHVFVWHNQLYEKEKTSMNAIVDWDRKAPQWAAVLAAVRGTPPPADLRASPFWRIYGPLADGGRQPQPLVVGQMGQSLDGRIATPSGHSHYINGANALVHLHRLRALVDAVVVGAGTALADDPQLTVRHVEGPQPARVVIDTRGRIPAAARCWRDDGVRRMVVETTPHARPEGVERLSIPGCSDGVAPAEIIAALGRAGFRRLLIEGGADTLSRFMAAGCVHRLHVMIAPLIIGSGPQGINLPAIATLDDAKRPRVAAYPFPEGDVLFDCELSP